MSEKSWNLGMEDAYFDIDPRFTNDQDYMNGYIYSESINSTKYYPSIPEMELTQTEEDICGADGHKYDGEDSLGPRCYCGKRRDFS